MLACGICITNAIIIQLQACQRHHLAKGERGVVCLHCRTLLRAELYEWVDLLAACEAAHVRAHLEHTKEHTAMLQDKQGSGLNLKSAQTTWNW